MHGLFFAENVYRIVNFFLCLHNYETKCFCVRDKLLISLSFSSSILTRFSLFFFPSIIDSWFYTWSCFCTCEFLGWRTDKSSSPYIYSHHESNQPLFIFILIQFYERRFADRCYRTLVPRVRGIHLAPKNLVIYNSAPNSSNSQA